LKTSDFYYDLPEELIAQTPLAQRDSSRLMTVDRTTGAVSHRVFTDILDLLNPGDCLVVNDSRVLPARLLGNRATGGAVEVLLLKDEGNDTWECLTKPGRKTQPGTETGCHHHRRAGTGTGRSRKRENKSPDLSGSQPHRSRRRAMAHTGADVYK